MQNSGVPQKKHPTYVWTQRRDKLLKNMCVGSCDELLDQSWIEWIFNRSLWISRQTLSSLPTEITIFQKKVKKSTLLLPVSAFASDPPISTIHSDSDAAGSACKLSGDKQSYDKDWNDYLKTIDLVPLITTFGYYERPTITSRFFLTKHFWLTSMNSSDTKSTAHNEHVFMN